jgi:hypothetical protein
VVVEAPQVVHIAEIFDQLLPGPGTDVMILKIFSPKKWQKWLKIGVLDSKQI